MEDVPQLGKLLSNDEKRRDAIHIAIAPVRGIVHLQAGDHVGFATDYSTEYVCPCEKPIGIVDPFLPKHKAILAGERFWLFLYPQSITSLRHVWRHPAFDEAATKANNKRIEESLANLRNLNKP